MRLRTQPVSPKVEPPQCQQRRATVEGQRFFAVCWDGCNLQGLLELDSTGSSTALDHAYCIISDANNSPMMNGRGSSPCFTHLSPQSYKKDQSTALTKLCIYTPYMLGVASCSQHLRHTRLALTQQGVTRSYKELQLSTANELE